MRNYELTTITRVSSREVAKSEIQETLKKHSVSVTAEEDWGQRKLWHPIKHEEQGIFHHYKCSADPNAIEKLEKEFLINQNILRSMVVRLHG
ncbi:MULTISPECIES: 30S ribosomal protein S6 [Leptospira]|uniref:30S ribosomal protein S6 n=1 Tax=Leptospira TaxID=171 RepID=UPI0002BE26CF|nr:MULTISPECIES: 30S ribosomal protein S6 [Leptospira]EMJ93049.1 ribosomal protein S6 [Leptospira kirschneri str. JB]EMK03995.1 ribosomal protein S6 [Leptospira kirschneri]KXZ26990.1 30S ribosomal protein S6 [Leptospira kirschneri]KXZ34332.1 30S ribosomal protein S6 [Leptospira sp. ZV016]